MRLIVDADACPVIQIAVGTAKKYNIPVFLVCDTAHALQVDGAVTLTVSRGADSADYKIVNLLEKGDLVVTQDYGLAAMCLGRGARCLHQDGMEYTSGNIDMLLWQRHTAREIRMAGGRTKGPGKRKKEQDTAFEAALDSILRDMENHGSP